MKLSFQITNILAKTKRKKKKAPDPGEGSDQQQKIEHIWLKARLIKQWKQYVSFNISKGTAFLHQVLRIGAFGNQSKVKACRNKLVMQ